MAIKKTGQKTGQKKGRVNKDVFIAEYIKTGNCADSYVKACSNKKMSRHVASNQGSRLLANVGIESKVKKERETIATECRIGIQEVLLESWNMYKKLSADVPDEEGNVKTRDASNAKGFLEMVAKITGAFEKDNAQKSELTHTLKAEGMDGWAQIFPTITNNLSLTRKEN